MSLRRSLLPAAAAAIAALLVLGPLARANDTATDLKDCAMNAIERSICVYEAIMADIRDNFPMEAEGGITALRQTATTTFEATISREGARDLWTYEIGFDANGSVRIENRTEGVK